MASNKNLIKLCYYNIITKKKEMIEEFEDNQQLSNESPKLYIKKNENNTSQ